MCVNISVLPSHTVSCSRHCIAPFWTSCRLLVAHVCAALCVLPFHRPHHCAALCN